MKLTSGQKISFSLLISTGIFTLFVLLAETLLFSKLETTFYAQAKVSEAGQQLDARAEGYNAYIENVLKKICTDENSYMNSGAVRTFLEQSPSESEIAERKYSTESLFHSIPALKGIRIIDKNGRSVHYSSFDSTDILKLSGYTKSYKNYPDILKSTNELDISLISHLGRELQPLIFFDTANGRLVLSVPLVSAEGLYAADFVFYFNLFSIQQELTRQGVLAAGEIPLAVSAPDGSVQGLVFNVPYENQDEFSAYVLEWWQENLSARQQRLISSENGTNWALLDSPKAAFFHVSELFDSRLLELPRETKLLVEISVFITILLLVLLLFNLRQEPTQKLRQKVKRLQLELLKEYLDNRDTAEWEKTVEQLNRRKSLFTEQLKKDIGGTLPKELETYADKSWEEIIRILTAESRRQQPQTPAQKLSLEDIRTVVEQAMEKQNAILQKIVLTAPRATPAPQTAPIPAADEVPDADEILDADEIPDSEEILDADEILDGEEIPNGDEILDADEIPDADEILDADEISDADEIPDGKEIPDEDEIPDGEEILDGDEIPDADEILDADEITAENTSPAMPFGDDFSPEKSMEEEERAIFIETDEEEFATTDNILGEEMRIGSNFVIQKDEDTSLGNFVPTKILFFEEDEEAPAEPESPEEIEAAEELAPAGTDYFSLARFAAYDAPLSTLESAPGDSIIEKDGVFEIAKDIELASVQINAEFKELVDSVLQ